MARAEQAAHHDDALFGEKRNGRDRSDPFDGFAFSRSYRLDVKRIAIGFFKEFAQGLAPEKLFRTGKEDQSVGLTL